MWVWLILNTPTPSMAHFKGAPSEGARAVSLLKKREKEREELEKMKQKIAEVNNELGIIN